MAFNINEFKTVGITYGGARPSLFQVILTPPAGIPLGPAGVTKFAFTCKAAELPESTINSIEVPYFGRKIKVAGERSYSDWNATVINDEDFSVRSMFEAWHNFIDTVISNVRLGTAAEEQYKALVDITQFSKTGVPLRSYQLVGAFPTQVSGIGLSWDSANAIEEFTVNFAYDYWVPILENGPGPTSGQVTEYMGAIEAGPASTR